MLCLHPGSQVLEVLAKVDDWQFDAFKLSEVSGGRPLSLLSYALLKRCEVRSGGSGGSGGSGLHSQD